MAVNPIPEGHSTVTPYLIVNNSKGLLQFVRDVFNAETLDIMQTEDGTVMHATLKIGSSTIMLSEAAEQWPPMPTMLHMYVTDCDAVYARALEHGAVSVREPRDEFYGDRSSGVKDAFGNQWWFATHIEDVPDEEMQRRAAEAFSGKTAEA